VSRKRFIPFTLWLGVGLIVVLELLLFADVRASHRGAVHSQAEIEHLSPPATAFTRFARWVAVNFTALIWPAYVVFLDGLLVAVSPARRSPIRARPHHFSLLCLGSIPVWCLFDVVNFYFIHAWSYIGIPPGFWNRAWGYVLAFGAVAPGMLLAAQVYLDAGLFRWADLSNRSRVAHQVDLYPSLLVCSIMTGLVMFVWPLIAKDPVTNLTLWTSLIFLVDPLNLWMGRPSFLNDLARLNFARPLALFAGGLTSGLLWEFWNYWALAKWVYHLPFLGRWENIKYFEMPLPGLLGFLPFGLECWVMWQVLRIPLDGLAEPLVDELTVL